MITFYSRRMAVFNRLLPSAIFAFLTSTTSYGIDVTPPDASWEEANRSDTFVIFTKDGGDGIRKLLAITDIPATPEKVFQVVTDFDHYTEFMPYVEEAKVLTRSGDSTVTTYQRISPPLVSERDYVIEVKLTRGPSNGGIWKSQWTAKPDGEPERDGVVRVKLNTGSWTIAPGATATTSRVTYALHTSPGGSIPDFVANKSNTVAIPKLIEAVTQRCARQ